jgi:L-ascorbate metabolism protein UlaG (beta-lactamase superfamily)
MVTMKISARRMLVGLLFAIVAMVVAVMAFVAGYGYDGPVSDHFDGSCFYSAETGDHTFSDMVRWMWEMETVDWPQWVDDPKQPAPIARVGDGELRVTYVNHATMLIQIDGLNILTDPIWSNSAGPFGWLGPARVRAPGVEFDSLPRIDYVLISHDHWDHLDLPTLETIVARDHPKIITGLGVKPLLPEEGMEKAVELDWWQSHWAFDKLVCFTFVPARHQSGRWPFVGNKTLWGGFVIEGRSGDQVYFAGDTGYGAFLDTIHERFNRVRLAILPIGNYEKRWIMKSQHMNPDDAVQAHLLLGATRSVGMHYATFAEHPEQSIDAHERDLAAALTSNQVPLSEFRVLAFGEGMSVPPRAGRLTGGL